MRAALQPIRLIFSWHETDIIGIPHGNVRELCSGERYLVQPCPKNTLWVTFPQKHAQAMSRGVLFGTYTNTCREQANDLNMRMISSPVPGIISWGCLTYLQHPAWCVFNYSLLVPTFLHWIQEVYLFRFRLFTCQVVKESRWRMTLAASLIVGSWRQVRNYMVTHMKSGITTDVCHSNCCRRVQGKDEDLRIKVNSLYACSLVHFMNIN